MASALQALANATVAFQVPGTGTVVDPATGNVTAAASTTSASLFLKASEVVVQDYPGVNAVGTLFEGYAVAPATLDSRVGVGTQGLVVFGTAAAVPCVVTAVRTPYGNTGVLGQTLSAVLGDRITLESRGQG